MQPGVAGGSGLDGPANMLRGLTSGASGRVVSPGGYVGWWQQRLSSLFKGWRSLGNAPVVSNRHHLRLSLARRVNPPAGLDAIWKLDIQGSVRGGRA